MTVKILSMQRVLNYGSFMQAYALKREIESLGRVVRFADFEAGTPRHRGVKVKPITRLDRLKRLPQAVLSPMSILDSRRFRRNLRYMFEHVAWPILGMGRELDLDHCADVFVIGSDEVFNYTQNHRFGYVPAFFGHGVQAERVVAYAASAGYANVDDVEADGMVDEIASGLGRFSHIGVRDNNTFELVRRFSGTEPTMVLDPTLIHDFTEEIRTASTVEIGRPYVLVYAYHGRLDESGDITAVRRLAARRGWLIVSAGFHHRWCDLNLVPAPFELLRLFQGAAAVVTDTFHGSIFATLTQRPFAALLRHASHRGSNANKLTFLLEQLGLESRIAPSVEEVGDVLESVTDFGAVHHRLAPLARTSRAFLAESVDTRRA